MLYLQFFLAMTVSLIDGSGTLVLSNAILENTLQNAQISDTEKMANNKATEISNTEITITSIGDNTIGYDTAFGYSGSFIQEVDYNGIDYPYKNVAGLFLNDDLTIANLETTLTDSKNRAVKKFKFAGKPEYRNMLVNNGIDAVNLANNHIMDYLEQGYQDTMANLNQACIGFFGEDIRLVKDIKGVKVGMLGYQGWSNNGAFKTRVSKDIAELKEQAKIVVVSFHWGNEGVNYPNNAQMDLGRFSIDCGADLVLGHHPHVIQGIENYNGKNIVYSLGNFVFGGNKNPADKDTFIFQQKFVVSPDGELTLAAPNIIPASLSSVNWRNNYQPVLLQAKEAERVLNRLRIYSSALEYGLKF
jgi:poly-gamma-glutamate synthesis protein (capsule biosynthesis protein)